MEPFETVYNKHYQALYRYVFRYFGQKEPCEDIVQETFIRLYGQRQKEEVSFEKAWLYRVATNLSLSSLKRQKTWQSLQPRFAAQPSTSPAPDEILEQLEDCQRVRAALARLNERDRTLLMLYQEEMSYREMAEITGIKPTSVGKLLSRAMERCARVLEKKP